MNTSRQDVSDPAIAPELTMANQGRGRSRPVCCPTARIAGGKERRLTRCDNGRAAAHKCRRRHR